MQGTICSRLEARWVDIQEVDWMPARNVGDGGGNDCRVPISMDTCINDATTNLHPLRGPLRRYLRSRTGASEKQQRRLQFYEDAHSTNEMTDLQSCQGSLGRYLRN